MVSKASRYKSRIGAALIILIGAVFSLLIACEVLIINTTRSSPVGLWVSSGTPIERGNYVVVPVESFAEYTRYAGYPFKRTRAGRGDIAQFLKKVVACSGDVVARGAQGITINGELLPDSKALSHDRLGNRLTAYDELPRTLLPGELWLTSQSPRGFDSRYLGYTHEDVCRKVRPVLTF